MIIVSIVFGIHSGINVFAFMGAEVSLKNFKNFENNIYKILNSFFKCFILSLKTLHILIRYGMFLYDMRQGVNSDSELKQNNNILKAKIK
jgi:hypothetical protein